jgi:hypothetical protein
MGVFRLDKPFYGVGRGRTIAFPPTVGLAAKTPLESPSMNRQPAPTCADCYFRRHGLCAMTPERPCPTFRAATRALQPPRQPRLVPLAASGAAA